MARRRGVIAGVAAAALGLLLGGCQMLMGGAFGDDYGDFPSSSPIAAYSHGTATISIKGGETVVLDELGAGASVDSLYGSDVRWSSSSGWHFRVAGAGAGSTAFDGVFVGFDRITDGEHWSSYDDGRCIVDIAVVTAVAFRGTASCKGLVWFDALDMPMSPVSPRPVDQPKFDAEVTFEATR